MLRILQFFLRGQNTSSLSSLTLLCAGLMLALGGMILLLRSDLRSFVPDSETTSEYSKSARFKLVCCHLSALTVWLGLPLGNLIFPYLIWHSGRENSPELNQRGIDCLNFQLSLTLYLLLSALMFYVLIGFIMLIGLFVLHVSCAVYAAVRAAHGEPYRYPLTIDVIKTENRNRTDSETV
jgi:uncharacterized protein